MIIKIEDEVDWRVYESSRESLCMGECEVVPFLLQKKGLIIGR